MYIPYSYFGSENDCYLCKIPNLATQTKELYTGSILYIQHSIPSSSFEIIKDIPSASFLIVGSGGSPGLVAGAASAARGGGGAGGLFFTSSIYLKQGRYNAIIGLPYGTGVQQSLKSSSFSGPEISFSVAGGADSVASALRTGASGAGGNDIQTGSAGIPGQGNKGGDGRLTGPFGTSGGGGGYSFAGQDAPAGVGGNGGDGLYVSIFSRWGASGWFAGGGGGGCSGTQAAGTGGLGGGGQGGRTAQGGSSGAPGTGGGGGGKNPNGFGGTGGSGDILISYEAPISCMNFDDYTWWTSCCDSSKKYMMAISKNSSIAASGSVIYNTCESLCMSFSSSVNDGALPSGSACYDFNANRDSYGYGGSADCIRCITLRPAPCP